VVPLKKEEEKKKKKKKNCCDYADIQAALFMFLCSSLLASDECSENKLHLVGPTRSVPGSLPSSALLPLIHWEGASLGAVRVTVQ
jgi:hypothetical protein